MAKETISQTEGLCKEVSTCIRIAYDKGYKQGQKDMEQNTMAVLENGKMIGREEAWEYARKIFRMTAAECIAIFDSVSGWVNYSASEAIAKIKEYEEKQKAVTIQQEKDCDHCSKVYGTLGCCTTVSNKWVYSCEEGHKQYAERHKADGEIKIGDKVRTTQDRDYNGNVLFSIGTIGVIKKIDKGSGLPYQVATKDSIWEWWYSEDMLEVIRDDEITIGDEVYIVMENYPSVVTCVFSESGLDNPKAVHITGSGRYAVTPCNQLHKTGRHFDQIAEVLEQLKGE